MVIEAVNAFGSGVEGLSVLFPPSHSTHVYPFFSLVHSSLVSSHSPRFWVCWLLTHRPWAILVSRRNFLPLHELLNAQALAIRVLLTAMHSHAENFPPVSHFRAQEFPGFYPRRFPLWIGEWSG